MRSGELSHPHWACLFPSLLSERKLGGGTAAMRFPRGAVDRDLTRCMPGFQQQPAHPRRSLAHSAWRSMQQWKAMHRLQVRRSHARTEGGQCSGYGAGLEPLSLGTHFSKAQNFEKRYQFIQFNPGQLLKTPHTGQALPTVSCRNRKS